MNAGTVTTASEQGFATVGLQGRRAALAMVPELGGRIISLKSARTGREWCWHRPRPDGLWASDPGDDFGAGPQAGIDESVPTVAACAVQGRNLPDHGEVWFQEWRLDPEALAEGELRASMALTVSPLVFTRGIRLDPEGDFRFEYALRNTGSRPEPYLWCIHPLLALAPGDRLELPAEVASLRLNGGLGAPIAMGDRWSWPEPFPGIRLDACEVPGMPGGCLKGFAGPLATGRAAVVNDASGDRLEWRWDPAELPWLGLWLNRGHAGYHHVALEPGNGAPDSLAEAVEGWHAHGTIQPRATVRWSLSLMIS